MLDAEPHLVRASPGSGSVDVSFACPECGSPVAVRGLAPGRQVRCGFCHRLLEVPYLPRVPVGGWKRRRFGRMKWVPWAWAGVATLAAVVVLLVGIRLVGRQFRSLKEGSIQRLLASSREHEAAGQLGMALVDLDAALDEARHSDVGGRFPIEEETRRRGDLARRDAEAALDGLIRPRSEPFPLGEWLNLIARSNKDADLRPLKVRIDQQFRRSVEKWIAVELEAARRSFDAGRVAESLAACDRIAGLLPHLPREVEPAVRRDAEAVVARLVETYGVAIETPRGHFVLGSYETYRSKLVPVLAKALEAKGYLPFRESSPWKAAWQRARYHLRLEVNEQRVGTYLSSQNRLTRIEARLTLTSADNRVWGTSPTALTTVPMPGLPAYLATKVALKPERDDECERLLYEDARSQIEGRFAQALGNMPPCSP
jgi:hypothetical protein